MLKKVCGFFFFCVNLSILNRQASYHFVSSCSVNKEVEAGVPLKNIKHK